MTEVAIYNVHHLPPERPLGGIIKQVQVGPWNHLSSRFGSMRAYYDIWKGFGPDRRCDIIGFQGYRKHITFYWAEPNTWNEVSKSDFYRYQDWLAQWDGQLIRDSLREHDIVITPPFDLRGAGGMKADFCRSRSAEDWEEFERVTAEHGFRNWEQPDVISHWFITTDRIFNHFMDNWWGVFSELEECVHSRDAHDPAYSPRAFDFLTERFFTMWLRQQELKTIILPLMVCWDAK